MIKDILKDIFNKNNIKVFLIIFWMIIYPLFLYFFDNYISSEITSRLLFILLIISIIMYVVIIYSDKRIRCFLLFFLLLTIIPSFFVISAFSLTGTIYHRSDFDVIFTTDLDESIEFVSQFTNFKIILLLFLYFAPIVLLFFIKIKASSISKINRFIIVIGGLFLITVVCINNWKLLQGEYHVVDFYKSYYQFINNRNFEIWKAKRDSLKFNDPVTSGLNIKDPKLFVLIIGESLSKAHMQLYGYGRETNPNLSKIKKQLYIFRDVISPAATTVDVMKYILTFADLKHPEYFLTKRSIVNLFSELNYNTIWIGNQSLRGNRNNVSHSIIAQECNQFYDVTSETDQVVIDKFNDILKDKINKNMFVIIHLRGCHTKYSSRYPKNFNYFDHTKIPIPYNGNLSNNNKIIIDQYDNCVRFNDYIIYSIINITKTKAKYSWVLYFSDHGEELFEYRGMFGHNSRNFSKYMCNIPFILWVSNSYKNANIDYFQQFESYQNRPYSTENLIYSIADLSKIKFKDFDPKNSIFSKEFIKQERYVYDKLYDSIPPVNGND